MKTKIGWILYIAKRYFRVKRKTSNIATSFIAIGGLSVGVMALITVLSVMNGFQMGFIENILEISSFHIRMTPPEGDQSLEDNLLVLENYSGIQSALPFFELQTLIQGGLSGFTPCLIRAVPVDTREMDPNFVTQLNVFRGRFDLSQGDGILLGYEMAYRLGVLPGDTINLVSMAGENFSLLSPEMVTYRVTGIFKSGFYEFDAGLALVSLEGAESLASGETLIYGLKMKDSNKAMITTSELKRNSYFDDWKIQTWEEYNRSFFGALRLEKNAMMVLMGLIFLVVGVNIYNAQKRNVMERYEEIGILRSMGASPRGIQGIFLGEGVMIGLLGGIIGTALGLLLTQNIKAIFNITESLVGLLFQVINLLMGIFGDSLNLSASSMFYFPEIPVRIIYSEVVLIFLFAFFSSLLAAYFASRRASIVQPTKVLRYE